MNNVETLANRLAESGALTEPGLQMTAGTPVACTPVGAADYVGIFFAGAGLGYVAGRAAYAYKHGFTDGVEDDIPAFQGGEAGVDELLRHRLSA